jgi:hypothetical protein
MYSDEEKDLISALFEPDAEVPRTRPVNEDGTAPSPKKKTKTNGNESSGESSDHSETVKKKGPRNYRRAQHACAQCKKSKQRCDDQRPCSRCVSKGKECHDESGSFFRSVDEGNELSTVQDHVQLIDKLCGTLTEEEIQKHIVDKPIKW